MLIASLVNGCYSASVSVQDRGLAYGDGLFETIKVRTSCAVLLEEHLARLAEGCERLNISCDIDCVRSDITRLLAEHRHRVNLAIIKIIITRESTGRSYQTHYSAGYNRVVLLSEFGTDYSLKQCAGVSVVICDTRLSIHPKLAGMKHLCRLENVLARAEWDDANIAEGLLLDTSGRVVEGTMSNLFLVKGGGLLTPAVHRCGVDGVIRRYICQHAPLKLGITIKVSDISLSDLYQADELFLCNSLIGVWPITSIGCHNKSIGSVTRNVQRLINDVPGEQI